MSILIDKLVRTSRKTVALVIERDGSLTVRAPLRLSEGRIRLFVESHAGWIVKNRARLLATPLPPSKRYAEGETFLYLGQPYPLRLVPHQRPSLTFDGATFKLAKSALPRAEQAFVRWYKAQAARVLLERVGSLAEKHAFRYQKGPHFFGAHPLGLVQFARGTLSFTYRLVMAPLDMLDYVVMHELVHTQIHNHSKAFWNKVAELMPDYKRRLAWLKKNGKSLM